MDCFVALLLAMTKGWQFVVYRLLFVRKNKGASGVCGLLFVRNDEKRVVIARVACNSWQSRLFLACHCEALKKPWQSIRN